MRRRRRKPKLAVWKFSSCDGCQLTLLDCEAELLSIAGRFDIAYFLEATRVVRGGPYDLSLVEGSISTSHDIERIGTIRAQSRTLVAIGACAAAGGIAALRNFCDYSDVAGAVYARPELLDALPASTAIGDHVKVDFTLRGCPIEKSQLLEVLAAFLDGRTPAIAEHSVCLECKLAGQVCVMVARGTPCLGPVTQAGCGSRCPRYARGCYGCFGPQEHANTISLDRELLALGLSEGELAERYRSFNAGAAAFRAAGDTHERR
jgi:coenzyme F420-reducing hydrogenase gamma subunit